MFQKDFVHSTVGCKTANCGGVDAIFGILIRNCRILLLVESGLHSITVPSTMAFFRQASKQLSVKLQLN
jgi:hypothetical protein